MLNPPPPSTVSLTEFPMMRSLPLPPIAPLIMTPLAMVKPPETPTSWEMKPPALGPVNGAARRSMMHDVSEPALLMVLLPPAFQMHDQPVPAPFAAGNV